MAQAIIAVSHDLNTMGFRCQSPLGKDHSSIQNKDHTIEGEGESGTSSYYRDIHYNDDSRNFHGSGSEFGDIDETFERWSTDGGGGGDSDAIIAKYGGETDIGEWGRSRKRRKGREKWTGKRENTYGDEGIHVVYTLSIHTLHTRHTIHNMCRYWQFYVRHHNYASQCNDWSWSAGGCSYSVYSVQIIPHNTH